MKDVHAFIVGIERYEQGSDWNFRGPVTNACRIADLLLSADVPAANIHLFLECTNEVPPIVEALRKKGLKPEGNGRHDTIDTFWRTKLGKDIGEHSKLIFFWSGHGYTDSTTRRIFLCSDYTEELTGRVFNADNFIRLLKGHRGSPFDRQVILADVCGTYANAEFTTQDEACKDLKITNQIIYFGSPEGGYAKNPEGVGAFTSALLNGLADFKAWPIEKDLDQRLASAFEEVDLQVCRISHTASTGGRTDYPIGRGSAARLTGPLAAEAVASLERVRLTNEALRFHFIKTVGDLGLPELAAHRGNYGMVRALADLGDATEDQPSFGLIQFVTRVSRACPTPEITDWLAKVSEQRSTQVEARLKRERPVKRVLIWAHHDGKPDIARFRTSLREGDFSIPAECRTTSGDVAGWEEFAGRIGPIVEETDASENQVTLEIHFIVDAPSFDRAFHQIPMPDGQPIGQRFRCTVHYLHRERYADNWKSWCDQLEGVAVADLTKLPVDPIPASLPAGHGFCYASFAIGSGVAGTAEKSRLAQMLQVGTPYLCWLHGQAGDPGQILAAEIDALLEGGAIEAVPGRLKLRRLRGDGAAQEMSLVWDDPGFQPSTPLAAVGGSSG